MPTNKRSFYAHFSVFIGLPDVVNTFFVRKKSTLLWGPLDTLLIPIILVKLGIGKISQISHMKSLSQNLVARNNHL
jgi:hypothetical protein